MDYKQKRAMTKRFKNFVNPTTMKIKDGTRMKTASNRGYNRTKHSMGTLRNNSQMKMKTQKSKYKMIGADAQKDAVKFAYRA